MTDRHHPPPDDGVDPGATSDTDIDERALDHELAETDGLLGQMLADILVPPEGIERRTERNVEDELLRRSTLATAIDLLSIGWETSRRLFSDEPEELR
jgi:hypothetical protein